jgi:hypothetical protein
MCNKCVIPILLAFSTFFQGASFDSALYNGKTINWRVVLLVKNINRNKAIYSILVISSRFFYNFETNHAKISNDRITTIIEIVYNFSISSRLREIF